jgi:hypothetical protein
MAAEIVIPFTNRTGLIAPQWTSTAITIRHRTRARKAHSISKMI